MQVMSYTRFDEGPKTRDCFSCIPHENLVATSCHISLKDNYNFVKREKMCRKNDTDSKPKSY
jgi:hypothetical protein